MKIKTAIVREKGKPFQFEEVDLQSPQKGEVLVKNPCQWSLSYG